MGSLVSAGASLQTIGGAGSGLGLGLGLLPSSIESPAPDCGKDAAGGDDEEDISDGQYIYTEGIIVMPRLRNNFDPSGSDTRIFCYWLSTVSFIYTAHKINH